MANEITVAAQLFCERLWWFWLLRDTFAAACSTEPRRLIWITVTSVIYLSLASQQERQLGANGEKHCSCGCRGACCCEQRSHVSLWPSRLAPWRPRRRSQHRKPGQMLFCTVFDQRKVLYSSLPWTKHAGGGVSTTICVVLFHAQMLLCF